MKITLADLWFVINVPYKSSQLPDIAYYGETAEADAMAEAARANADLNQSPGWFRLTYKAVDYQEVLDMVVDNERSD